MVFFATGRLFDQKKFEIYSILEENSIILHRSLQNKQAPRREKMIGFRRDQFI